MFVDLTPDMKEIARRQQIAADNNFEFVPQYHEQWKSGTGIYQCSFPFNFPHQEFLEFEGVHNVPFDQAYEVFPNGEKAQYGVADSVEQLKEYFKEEMEDPHRKYFLSLTPVFQDKSNAGKGGGWRWHKWGDYIGKLDPQFEYLDDEDFGEDFQYVICFHLYEVKSIPSS
jgi:hypothetical protein